MKFRALFFSLVLFSLSGCAIILDEEVGNGNRVTEEKSLSRFENLEVSGSFDVELVPSTEYRVVIEADENIQEFILIDQDGDKLKIQLKDQIRISIKGKIKVTVYMEKLRSVDLAGSGLVKTRSQMTHPDKMEFSIAGSGDMELDVKSPSVEISIGGSGELKAMGKTERLEVDIAGSGDFNGLELLSEVTEVSIAGSGNASVYASRELDVSVAGSGDVEYKGNPSVTKSIAGSGSVKSIQ